MATINYNDKGFFVIETSQAEIVSAHPLNRGICDRCNESSPKGYYVAVLNYWMCPKCFDSWYSQSVRYSSDIPYEVEKYNAMCGALGLQKWIPDSRDDKNRYKGNKTGFIKELSEFCRKNNLLLDDDIKKDIWIQIQYHPSPIFFGFRDAYERATNPRR